MAKICRKYYPKHKLVFLSPCDFKKVEANNSPHIDYILDYDQLRKISRKYKVQKSNNGQSIIP